jgi:hypothetical protein
MSDSDTDMFWKEAHRKIDLLKELCLIVVAGGYTPEEAAEKLGVELNYIEKFIRQDLQSRK